MQLKDNSNIILYC